LRPPVDVRERYSGIEETSKLSKTKEAKDTKIMIPAR